MGKNKPGNQLPEMFKKVVFNPSDMSNTDIVGTGKNSSNLTLGQCRSILSDLRTVFDSLSNADLDSLYFVAMGRWPYHLTREGHIYWLNQYRAKNTAC